MNVIRHLLGCAHSCRHCHLSTGDAEEYFIPRILVVRRGDYHRFLFGPPRAHLSLATQLHFRSYNTKGHERTTFVMLYTDIHRGSLSTLASTWRSRRASICRSSQHSILHQANFSRFTSQFRDLFLAVRLALPLLSSARVLHFYFPGSTIIGASNHITGVYVPIKCLSNVQ